MLKELFDQKREYLNHFFDSLDLVAAEKFFNIIKACQGLLCFTGVGKSGLVAEKTAVTMTSTGSRALFISPTNALHGDLGMLTKKDLCIMLSKSGESDELLRLIPYLRNRGVGLLSVVSSANSRLAKASDFSMSLPLTRELCPFNMAPTTSTAIQLIFGDVMAIALMRDQNFSLQQYAMNHPAGSIGKRITMRVQDIMLRDQDLPLCTSEQRLSETLLELSNKKCGCVLVVNEHMILEGIFTDGDLRRALLGKGPHVLELKMEQLMTRTPRMVAGEMLAWDAMKMMEADPKHPITCLPVVDEQKKVCGIIKLHDIIQSGL